MRPIIDLTGRCFGKLTVLSLCKLGDHGSTWNCICNCGNTLVVRGDSLKKGNTQSCGCYSRALMSARHTKHGLNLTSPQLLSIWRAMRIRCNNKKTKYYRYYGGKGIQICSEWENPINFCEWAISHGYAEGLEIDRIDNNGSYCPENCRWVTRTQNACNKSSNKRILFQNKSLTYSEWEREFNLPPATITRRITQLHWNPIRALTTPIKSIKRINQ
jgi:hypothetical protein